MIVERFLTPYQLKRYRRWKRDVRTRFWLWMYTWTLAIKNGGLKRLVDVDFQPVFICGVAGSGTTLLGGLIDQNYENGLCIHVSDRMNETDRDLWMEKSTYYDQLSEYVADLDRPRTYSVHRVRNAVLGLYRRLSSYPKKSNVVLDKAPNSHMLRVGRLRAAFPAAKIIMIYRDPVEVIEGLKRKWPRPYAGATIDELCDFWNRMHSKFLDDVANHKATLIISYDQLTQEPERILVKTAERIGLVKRNKELDYQDHPNTPGKGLRNIVGGRIQVLPDAFREVSTSISKDEIEFIRNETRDTVNRLHEVQGSTWVE